MSFSGDVKRELVTRLPRARHCQIAELTAVIAVCGRIQITAREGYRLWIHTENPHVAEKFYVLAGEIFGAVCEVNVRTWVRKDDKKEGFRATYTVAVTDDACARQILGAAKLLDREGMLREDLSLVSSIVVQQSCCKRAFIRGCFLASGSISDPAKGYHLEVVMPTKEKADQLADIINSFDLDAKVVRRKQHYIVYLKEGAKIVDLLGVMKATVSLMNLENMLIYKDVRNTVNRQVNCETANLRKTASASARQLEDILYLRDHGGFGDLKENLREMAELRLENPEASLTELGELLSEPLGKSGVNHRLKKLSAIADERRSKE